jgi:hypothetical protein
MANLNLGNIDLGEIVTTLTGHASSAGLVGGLAAAVATQAITNAAVKALTNTDVLHSLNPLGLQLPLPLGQNAPAPAAAPAINAPVEGPKTISVGDAARLGLNQAQLTALGYVIVG